MPEIEKIKPRKTKTSEHHKEHVKKRKSMDAKKYLGAIKNLGDGLKIQKKLRDEWK